MNPNATNAFPKNKAAESGMSHAQVSLGWGYMTGEFSLPVDYAEAMKWNAKAVALGHGEGAANIGLLHERGWGVPVDYAAAVKWYRDAIQSKTAWSGQAEMRLGWLYQNGLGVGKDIALAARLYRIVQNDMPQALPEFRREAAELLSKLPN